ncbi:Sec-independent protein translocase protein TatB [Vibrio cincinnatiensis]|uniref:Sec-independent protein translocase protein TatB n=1 Tax=Vibrio cincinnatiensis TaxID=675 RepID=UPI001EDD6653|nr:Sec-independent protein translocase subunit TatB [Vibrio cincinnatiensis]MCG3740316.1 Sec-independent protein translocase subunit TatB [Vibrio cincinnatiensis]
MFDIGFWELILISVVALVVLGPERLPHAIRSVAKFVAAAKGMVNSVKDELAHELKVQELQEHLRKAEQLGMKNLSPELQESVDQLKQAAQEVQRPYASATDTVTKSDASIGSSTLDSDEPPPSSIKTVESEVKAAKHHTD